MRGAQRTTTFIALSLATSAACRVGYEDASGAKNRDLGGSSGDSGRAGEASGGTGATGGSGGAAVSGGSSAGGTTGEGGESVGGASGSSTGGSSGASGSGGASGAGGSSGAGGGMGGNAGSGGCSPTNGGVEICDGMDNDCTNGADDGVTCPSTCRGIPFDGNGYMFCDAEISNPDADAACTMLGMHLVKVGSVEENDFIASNMFGTNLAFVWLGGDDLAVEGSWNWQDGTLFWTGTSSGSAPSGAYTNWYPGYPGSGVNTDCLEMRDDGTWDDKQCSQGKRYVCELSF